MRPKKRVCHNIINLGLKKNFLYDSSRIEPSVSNLRFRTFGSRSRRRKIMSKEQLSYRPVRYFVSCSLIFAYGMDAAVTNSLNGTRKKRWLPSVRRHVFSCKS
jgi:hypothetical protein